jgi:hypothetical protein
VTSGQSHGPHVVVVVVVVVRGLGHANADANDHDNVWAVTVTKRAGFP